MEEYREYLDQELRHLDYAPIAFITAKDGKNVQGVLDLAQHLYQADERRITTHRLNEAIRQIMSERHPSTPSGRRARIYYVTQTEVAPPTIVLFVNNPAYLNDAYQRFMVNRLRELLPYAEVPIRLIVRARERQSSNTTIDADQDTKRPTKPTTKSARPRRGVGGLGHGRKEVMVSEHVVTGGDHAGVLGPEIRRGSCRGRARRSDRSLRSCSACPM